MCIEVLCRYQGECCTQLLNTCVGKSSDAIEDFGREIGYSNINTFLGTDAQPINFFFE